jgi:hypothetical protein
MRRLTSPVPTTEMGGFTSPVTGDEHVEENKRNKKRHRKDKRV